MGLSSSTTKTSSTQTPQVPDWIKAPAVNYNAYVGSLMDNPQTQGPTKQQQTAFNFQGGNLFGDPNAVTKFMNPYIQNVIDTSMADLNRARGEAIVGNSANATTQAGGNAWQSDRAGVADSLTNRDYLSQAASLSSNLWGQGFNNAQTYALNAANSDRTDATTMAGLGEQNRILQALQNPRSPEYLAMIQRLLGYDPNQYIGQTKTEKTKDTMSGIGALSAIGNAMSGAGAMGATL